MKFKFPPSSRGCGCQRSNRKFRPVRPGKVVHLKRWTRGAYHLTENFGNSWWKVNGKVIFRKFQPKFGFWGSPFIPVGTNQTKCYLPFTLPLRPPSFTRGAQQIGAARCLHGDVHVQMLLLMPLFEQLLRLQTLYLPIHACTYIHFRVPIKIYLSLYQVLSERCISHSHGTRAARKLDGRSTLWNHEISNVLAFYLM